jgi:hypothetical protein
MLGGFGLNNRMDSFSLSWHNHEFLTLVEVFGSYNGGPTSVYFENKVPEGLSYKVEVNLRFYLLLILEI